MQKMLLLVAFFYVLLCILVFVFQKNIMFFPDQTPLKDCPSLKLFGGFSFESEDGMIRLYHLPSKLPSPKGWILHFHGNGGRACDRMDIAGRLLQLGYHVVLAEYPGYSEDRDLPSPHEIIESAKKSYEYIQSKNADNLPIVLFGESLGTGPSTYLASLKLKNISAMILQTPYTSFGDIGQKHYFYLPVKLLMKQDFKPYLWAKDVRVPVFTFHGDKDEVIPFEIGKKQTENFSPELMTFWEVKNAHHNDLLFVAGDEFWDRIEKFLNEKLAL